MKRIIDKIKHWYYARKVRRSAAVIKNIDSHMIKAGWRRTRRRQYWSEFIRNNADRAKLVGDQDKLP